MGSQHERMERIEDLRSLIQRLSAPDLTLTEAKVLRGRLSEMLERSGRPAGDGRMSSCPDSVPSHDIGDGSRRSIWPLETSARAAG